MTADNHGPPLIRKLTIKGFKSIALLIGFKFESLNVVIGANGAGKSNLIGFLRMLSEMSNRRLQGFVVKHGPVDGFFFGGPSETKVIEAVIESTSLRYRFRLETTSDEKLIVRSEYVAPVSSVASNKISEWTYESLIGEPANWHDAAKSSLSDALASDVIALTRIRVYHFHDTSHTAGMRRKSGIAQNEELQYDAGNLAAFLYFLRTEHSHVFELIVSTVRRIAPYLDTIQFNHFLHGGGGDEGQIQLIWKQHGSSYRFTAGHLSDGTIRFLCLATALLQPSPPSVIVLDEPELGLHPEAISLLGGLIRSASKRMQVIVATQSPTMLSQFDAEDVITIDHEQGCSRFRRLDVAQLEQWLQEYTLGEAWQKGLVNAEIQSPPAPVGQQSEGN
ncbi:Chromosome partition protein Smc [Stieleria neptunia]|uniref:Chromosome partition protein Smc n=1 Tax=Stieleria neptunia TaxID=2527979 RepID=A0A518HTR6_9BACT|nr:AAA family ATPase [Stieleria neptunia]QDV44250.1 Chromosome partition protein Smc [Stieleria neptunia]